MKKIAHSIRTVTALLKRLFPRGHLGTASVLIVITLTIGGGYYYAAHKSAGTFSQLIARYMALLPQNDAAVFLPGAPNNPVRGELNQVLTQVLSKQTSVSERLKLSAQGNDLVARSEQQLSSISDTGDTMDALIAQMQEMTAGTFTSSDAAHQFIALAKERASIVSDIRAYSYRAEFETKKIFDRVIAEQGRLTDSFIIELNADVPDVERQFNSRTNLYTDLQDVDGKIKDLAASWQ